MADKKPNATCKICGKPYHVCHDCEKFGSWRTVACSPECWQEWILRIEARMKQKESPAETKQDNAEVSKPRARRKKAPASKDESSE